MNTNKPSIQMIRWFGSAIAIGAALYSLNLAAFHTWAASFRENQQSQQWHEHWSNVFFGGTLFLIILAVFVVWFFRRQSTTPDFNRKAEPGGRA